MTLDQRIEQDLKELYNSGIFKLIQQLKKCQISEAKKLSKNLFGNPNELSIHGLPGYYTGKRDAATVMVMLNPGGEAISHNNPFATEVTLNRLGISKSSTLQNFVQSFKGGCDNFGDIDYNRLDNFDIKQAAFLKSWPKDSGVVIPDPFPTKDDKDLLKEAKRNVLMQKLQLELIPYASRNFKHIDKKRIKHLFPYVETLFEKLFESPRVYVIFCSDFFDELFKRYEADNPRSIAFGEKQAMNLFKNNRRAYCTPIRINYKGSSSKAIIAHTFPNKSLPNAYALMDTYGTFCYNVFTKSTI